MKNPLTFLGSKLFSKAPEKKNNSPETNWNFGNLFDFNVNSNSLITKTLAVSYYTQCSPLYNSIDLIAGNVADLIPRVWDKNKKVWVKDHPVLDLLSRPNAVYTFHKLLYSMVSFFLATGDSYLTASGKPMSPPKELNIYPSTAVSLLAGSDGFTKEMITSLFWGSFTYSREEIEKRFRYFNSQKTSEIWHTANFNPTNIQSNIYGMSPLNPIYYEINQHASANKHNLSVLLRGATPSGILSLEPAVDHDDFVRLQEQFVQQYAGASNAGRTMLLNGIGKYERTTMSQKDMDFLELKKEVIISIYRNLKIPLALITPETMTYDNMKQAMLMLYDLAVLPMANMVFSELTNFLIPRYGQDVNDFIITYDEGEIIAIEPRRNEQLKVLKELGVFTLNELRELNGADPLEGGDAIYGSANEMPIAIDNNGSGGKIAYDDVPAVDAVGGNDEKIGTEKEPKPKVTRSRFAEILKAKVGEDGNPMFREDEITKLADKHGLE